MTYNELRIELDSLRVTEENTRKIYYAIRKLLSNHRPDERSGRYCICEELYPCETIQVIEELVS